MRTSSRLAACAALMLAVSVVPAVRAQNWPNWRGPHFNGSTEATGLPEKFSRTENVKWVADLPGPSAGTPVVWEDHVFVSSVDLETEDLMAICLDRQTGKVKWEKVVGTGYRPGGEGNRIQLDDRSDYASPSPVTDGKRVVFFFGNGDLAAFDFAGKLLWERNIQKDYGDFAFQWTFSSTPQLYGGKLYLQILQRDIPVGDRGKDTNESYLLALDPATGKEFWKSPRPSKARLESREAYSTPIPLERKGRKELVIAGGDALTGHDPGTGKELWRWETYNPAHRERSWRLVPSPVAGGDVILVSAPKRAPVYAIKAGGTGDWSESGLAWKSEERSAVTTDVPTPLFYKGKFFVLSDLRRAISCVNPSDGTVIWSEELPGTAMCWGSPTAAEGKLFLINRNGDVIVMNPDTGKVIAVNPMGEEGADIRSSVAIAHDQLFIRTGSRLYSVGK